MATDRFESNSPGLTSPGDDAFAITPHNTNELAQVTRGIYVGGSGDVAVVTKKGTTVTFSGVVAPFIIPIRASKVLVTGTTATGLVGIV